MIKDLNFWGVDYGAKYAGSTVVCFYCKSEFHFIQSRKKEDADKLLRNLLKENKPDHVFIDAPLSLPNAYYGIGSDFHFRLCDRLTNAMSPMFMGGLTARAIDLKNSFHSITFIEAYPKLVRENVFKINAFYKQKDLKRCVDALPSEIKKHVHDKIINFHMLDALMAWYAGKRYFNGQHTIYGDKSEGIIIA